MTDEGRSRRSDGRTVGRSDGQLNDVMSEEWCPTRWPGLRALKGWNMKRA